MEITIEEWLGNSGFTLLLDGKEDAQFQGHFFADRKSVGPNFYQLFEVHGQNVEDEHLFFSTQKGCFQGYHNELESACKNPPVCDCCDVLLVIHRSDDLEWCHNCGVVLTPEKLPAYL